MPMEVGVLSKAFSTLPHWRTCLVIGAIHVRNWDNRQTEASQNGRFPGWQMPLRVSGPFDNKEYGSASVSSEGNRVQCLISAQPELVYLDLNFLWVILAGVTVLWHLDSRYWVCVQVNARVAHCLENGLEDLPVARQCAPSPILLPSFTLFIHYYPGTGLASPFPSIPSYSPTLWAPPFFLCQELPFLSPF